APHPPLHVRQRDFRGSLVSLNGSTLTLRLDDGTSQVFTLAAGVVLNAPGQPGSATAAQVAAATRLRVTGQQAAPNGPWSAVRLLIEDRPRPVRSPDTAKAPQASPPTGLVTAYSPGESVTLQLANGQTATYPLNGATRLLPPGHSAELAVGARVTLLAAPGAAAGDPAWAITVLPAGSPAAQP
ncbi:MAG: hypothetical protein ABI847_19700, partial [Anaerolineales bacterium]